MSKSLLDSFKLAGGQYYDLKKIIDKIKEDDSLNLLPDSENEHDEYAVEVYWKKHKLGFLSRTQNRIIHNLLVNDVPLTAKVSKINKEYNTQLEFDIFLED